MIDSLLSVLGEMDGLREAVPGEFTRRAFENGRIDLTEAEGLADLIEAETQSQRKAALALAEGGLRRQIADWQEQLLRLSALAERAIDYDDDELDLDPALISGSGILAAELKRWLDQPRIETLKDGVQVVVAGPPNAGKSSLVNMIAGEEKAIVTDIPGTTRDHIEVPLSLGGVPIRLTDTAGLREAKDPIEAIGVERANKLVAAADVLVWLGEPENAPAHARLIKLRAKADLPGRGDPVDALLAVSSRTGMGISTLLEQIRSMACSVLPPEDGLALNRRQAAHLADAAAALSFAADSVELLYVAENLRQARSAFDQLTGRAGFEAVLDALFSRFCLGK